jgi:hypothetical protein
MPGIEESADVAQQVLVERGWAAERQRQSVRHERNAFAEMPQVARQLAAGMNPVLRRQLEEIDACRAACAELRQQGTPESETGAGNGVAREFLGLR